MNRRNTRLWGLAILIKLALSCPALAGSFTAGAAAADITPDVKAMKVPSSGYGNRGTKPMEGVHDPVFCKALVVADDDSKACVVTCDLIGISDDVRGMIIQDLAGTGIDDHNLMMTASHTHSGPGAMTDMALMGVLFGNYNKELATETAHRITAAIKKADQTKRPAVIKAGVAEIKDAVRNRRDPAGSYDYDTRRFTDAYDPDHPHNLTDPEVTALRIEGIDGEPIAVLFNFAAHGTVLGSDNMLISADWPGVTQREIEQAIPGTVAMFINGAIGDQAPTMIDGDPATDLEYLEIIGGKVFKGVMDALDNAEKIQTVPVSAVIERRKVPPGKPFIDSSLNGRPIHLPIPKSLVKRYFPDVTLQAVRMGDVMIMATPMEMVTEIGHTMKQGAKGQGAKYPVVAGLANTKSMYCVTPEDFPQGGYEVGLTLYGEIEAGVLIGEQMMLVRKLMRD